MRILIIRFSSIGDIIQCMSITGGIKASYPNAQIDWITRKDMSPIVKTNKDISNVIEFDRKLGILSLIKLAFQLKKERYDLIYDAHQNIDQQYFEPFCAPHGNRFYM